jgi:hypothetical protein
VPISTLHSSLEDLARDFAERLHVAMAEATRAHGEKLLAEIFAAVQAGPAARLARREMRQAARARQRALADLTRRFLAAIEQVTRTRVHQAMARETAARNRAAARAAAEDSRMRAPARRRPRRRPLPPPPDPEQLKRDAENARLRALLRPTAEDLPAIPAAPPPVEPVLPPPRSTTPGEALHALEKEIQDAVPTLGRLGPERCGAQIAAWTGQVRELRDRLSPDVLAVMHAAIRIFLEHLTGLRAAMEAHFVDALEPKWRAPDWGVYIEMNRARAEGRTPALSPEQIEAHHRAMLRALVQPHRRNIPEAAAPIIEAAAAFLPADDGQLRSAIKRHSSERRGRPEPERSDAPATNPDATSTPAAAAAPHDLPVSQPESHFGAVREGESETEKAAPAVVAPVVVEDEPAPAEVSVGEFDQPWTK